MGQCKRRMDDHHGLSRRLGVTTERLQLASYRTLAYRKPEICMYDVKAQPLHPLFGWLLVKEAETRAFTGL